jgi:hypothetical protein
MKKDAARHIACEVHLVGNHKHGHASFVGQGAHHPQDFANQFRIERGSDFVEEHNARFHGESLPDRHALLLPVGRKNAIWRFRPMISGIISGMKLSV